MATKVTVFGQEEPKKELKKIEFVKVLNPKGVLSGATLIHSSFDNVECIAKGRGKYDIFNAWNDVDNYKITYLGHFNDGVV